MSLRIDVAAEVWRMLHVSARPCGRCSKHEASGLVADALVA